MHRSTARPSRFEFLMQLQRTTAFRLGISLLISIIIIFGIVAILVYQQALQALETGAERSSRQAIVQAGRQIDQLLRQYEDVGSVESQETVNKLLVFANADNPADYEGARSYLSEWMGERLRANRDVDSITLLSADLTRVISTLSRDNMIPELRDNNAAAIRELEWIKPVLGAAEPTMFLETRKNSFANVDRTRPRFAAVQMIAMPFDRMRPMAYILIEVPIGGLSKALEGFRLGEAGGYVIIDRDGTIIYTGDERLIGSPFTGPMPSGPLTAGESGGLYAADGDGVEHYYSYRRSELSDWTLIGYYSEEELHRPVRTMLLGSVWIMLLCGIAAAACVGVLVHRGIGRPLRKLRLLMQEGEQGNLAVRTDNIPDTEIGDLARAFNRMMDRISLAYYDTLTNLPNRRLLVERLEQAIQAAQETADTRLAVLFADLDRFKMVNDSLGHYAGDLLIQEVGQRLEREVGQEGLVARISGDEFVILLPRTNNEATLAIAGRLLACLREPFDIAGQELHMSGSIGVSFYPDDGLDAEALLKHADVAMYEAKAKGKNNVTRYRSEMTIRSYERLRLENDLHKALGSGEFLLHYQPRIDAVTGAVTGCEALIRWKHPVFGYVPPDTFIPVAEETGLIVPIGEWVLREAARQSKIWSLQGYPPLRVAVNVSARQFNGDLASTVERVLAEIGLDGRNLEIEITERVLMDNEPAVQETLHRLKALGLHLSIDDFGTGYSSLAFLMKFQVDALKIDKSFVRAIHRNPDNQMIAAAVIQLAHNLGMKVVSEGVETDEELEFLKSRGSDEMQGYYWSKPLPASEYAERFLRRVRNDAPEGR